MANTYTSADIIRGALAAAGEKPDGSSNYQQLAIKSLNDVHTGILAGASEFAPELGDAWSWARSTAGFILPAVYSTGTATLTNGSKNGTFSVAPTISLKNYNFKVTNTRTIYSIASHTANSTAFTLDAAYVDTSGSAAFTAMPLVVDLGAGILRLVEPFRQYNDRSLEYGEGASDMGRIYGMGTLEFWEKWPLRDVENSTPTKFTTIFSSEDSFIVRFNKYVSSAMKIDYDYIPIPTQLTDSSSSIPLLPFDFRKILEFGTAHYLCLQKKQMTDAETYRVKTATLLQAMHLRDQKTQKLTSKTFGQLTPRRDDTPCPWWVIIR